MGLGVRSRSSVAGRRESGVRSQETGNRIQDSGVRIQDSGDRSQETGDYFYLFSDLKEAVGGRQDSGVRSQESGFRRLFLFIVPTPHTPHPTSHTPLPHTPLPHQQTLDISTKLPCRTTIRKNSAILSANSLENPISLIIFSGYLRKKIVHPFKIWF